MSALRQSCDGTGKPLGVRLLGRFGVISSLQPLEKAKLVHASAPSVWLSITVTESSNKEDSPRSFSRAELEDMVRRWDFSEDEWACWDAGQKLLYGACDTFDEPELKEKLRALAEENPCFDGFD